MAMLPKDLSRCVHEALAVKNDLFQPGEHGSYYVPGDKKELLQEKFQITYQNIRVEGKRFHQERVLPAYKEIQTKKEKALKIYDKQGEVTFLSSFGAIEHTPYQPHFDFSISDGLLPCLTEIDYQGSRTYDRTAYFKLRSKYARSLFVLFSGSGFKKKNGDRIDQFIMNTDTLRQYLNLGNKYKNISAFKKRLIHAEKEFAQLGIRFTWSYQPPEDKPNAPKQFILEVDKKMLDYKSPRVKEKEKQNLFNSIPHDVKKFLMEKLDAHEKQIKNNTKTFLAYINLFSKERLIEFISNKVATPAYQSRKKTLRFGWVINAVKSESANEKKRVEEMNVQSQDYVPSNPVIREAVERLFPKQKETNGKVDSS